MSIVSKLFGIADLIDTSNPLGSRRITETLFGQPPSRMPEMFIGREGISNIGGEEAPAALKTLEDAQRDWFRLPAEEWDALYPKQGIAFDPVANKAMLEISDKNVDLRKGVDLNKIPENEILTFDEVFKADTLKKAYPDISDVTVSFIDDPVSSRLAAYAPEQNMILFNRQHPDWKQADTPVKVALHEIQHYVQGKELFTQGESFTGVLNQNDSYTKAASSLIKAITQSPADSLRFGKTEGLGFNPDNVVEAVAALSKPDGLSARKSLERSFKDTAMVDKFITKAANYPTLNNALQAKNQASQGYNKALADYMKVAGEVFARQTEQRRGMGTAERLANPAMRAIETDPANMQAGVTIDNMTAPATTTSKQDSFIAASWDLKEQTAQERKEGLAVKLKNPIKLDDGSRLSGFTSNSQNVFYGYDKNGEIFTIGKEYVNPETIVGSRDSDKTANKIRTRLTEMRKSETFTDPFQMQIPQSTIPEGM